MRMSWKKTMKYVGIGLLCGIVAIAAVGCAEKHKDEAAKEELPEMSAHAGDEVDIDNIEPEITPDINAGVAYDFESDAMPAPIDDIDVPEDAELVDSTANFDDDPVNLDDDPNVLFQVSEEWASEHDGLYALINDEFYTLMNELPAMVLDKYDVGYVTIPEGSEIVTDEVSYFLRDIIKLKDDIPSETRDALVTAGDFLPLQVHRSDSLVMFGKPVDSIDLFRLDFAGYTIPATQVDQTNNYYPVINHNRPNNIVENHAGVYTLEEEPVEDVRDLEYGKEYLYECYIGTEYRESKLVANSRAYSLNRRDAVELSAETTKFGYFLVDISNLETGFYTYRSNTVFEIVD